MAFINTSDLRKVQDALSPNADVATVAAAIAILATVSDGIASASLRNAADSKYASDDVEIDDEPGTSVADEGTWVAAWVWVQHPTCTACNGEGFADPNDEQTECEVCCGAGTVAL